MSDWRVVVDSNVAISAALLPRSLSRQAFDLAMTTCRVLVSEAKLVELDEVLRRPKFLKYIQESERLGFLAAYLAEAEIVEVRDSIRACRDARDDKFLELRVGGAATHLLTGDADRLKLNPYRLG